MKSYKGTLEFINHKGQTLLVSYTYYPGKGSQHGESPHIVDIDHAMNWMGRDMRGKFSSDERLELEEAIIEKESPK